MLKELPEERRQQGEKTFPPKPQIFQNKGMEQRKDKLILSKDGRGALKEEM